MKVISSAVLAAAAFALAACSSEPSSGDMLDALNANPNFAASLLMVVGMSGPTRSNAQVEAEVAKLKSAGVVEKAGCAGAQNAPGYVCDFKWGSKQPGGGTNWGQPMKARFYRSGNAWAVEI